MSPLGLPALLLDALGYIFAIMFPSGRCIFFAYMYKQIANIAPSGREGNIITLETIGLPLGPPPGVPYVSSGPSLPPMAHMGYTHAHIRIMFHSGPDPQFYRKTEQAINGTGTYIHIGDTS